MSDAATDDLIAALQESLERNIVCICATPVDDCERCESAWWKEHESTLKTQYAMQSILAGCSSLVAASEIDGRLSVSVAVCVERIRDLMAQLETEL